MTKRILITLAGTALLLLGLFGGSAQAGFGIAAFGGSITGPGGTPLQQAGAHPDVTTLIEFARKGEPGNKKTDGNVKDVNVQLPPGLIGDPSATSKCSQSDLTGGKGTVDSGVPQCPAESQVGITEIQFAEGATEVPVFNMEPPPGVAAEFGFNAVSIIIHVDARLANDGGYRLEARIENIAQVDPIGGAKLTLWGVPADPSHDSERFKSGSFERGASVGSARLPLMRNPTSCSNTSQVFHAAADSWQEPGLFHEASFSQALDGNPLIVNGCENVPFEASLTAQPTTNEADAPSGLAVSVNVPQNDNPLGIATSDLRDVNLQLPAGMTVNPSSANGLGSCSPAQVDLEGEAPATCPEDSKIGTVEIETPLLEKPLDGGVYLAQQGQNKFGSLMAIYIAIDDPLTGTVLKLPGKIAVNPADGQLSADFAENPQVPFSALRVKLFGGPRAALRTPPTCGTYTTEATFTPWSGTAPVDSSDSFRIGSGPNGSPCPNGGFAPTVEAASTNPVAGQFSPFRIRFARADGTQGLSTITAHLPEGLVGRLAGVPYCPESALASIPTAEGTGAAQLASPACPSASQVGTVTVGAGAGSDPFYLDTGKVYLAGPYKGAPLSLAIVTPAVAGPFDLGNVVVRAALQVDPETTRITAVSDPLPTILDGIPLDLRSVDVSIDRPGFTLNPTNCAPQAVTAVLTGTGGASADPSARYQVANCANLGFAPKLALKLKGATKRAGVPALTAVLTNPTKGASANIARVSTVLPKTEFIDNAHIDNPCTRVQFNEGACPAKSILGYAEAWSPLLDQPLRGPVYFRSNGGARELPDLVADLHGQIDITLVGFIDSVATKGSEASRVRTTFATVPDAPVSKFVLRLGGGRKGLLQNSANLCKVSNVAQIRMTAQNGKQHDFAQRVANSCGAVGNHGKR